MARRQRERLSVGALTARHERTVRSLCRGLRVRLFTAAALVTELEKAQKQYTLDRFRNQLDRVHSLICEELG